jgi:hypothetical protein
VSEAPARALVRSTPRETEPGVQPDSSADLVLRPGRGPFPCEGTSRFYRSSRRSVQALCAGRGRRIAARGTCKTPLGRKAERGSWRGRRAGVGSMSDVSDTLHQSATGRGFDLDAWIRPLCVNGHSVAPGVSAVRVPSSTAARRVRSPPTSANWSLPGPGPSCQASTARSPTPPAPPAACLPPDRVRLGSADAPLLSHLILAVRELMPRTEVTSRSRHSPVPLLDDRAAARLEPPSSATTPIRSSSPRAAWSSPRSSPSRSAPCSPRPIRRLPRRRWPCAQVPEEPPRFQGIDR